MIDPDFIFNLIVGFIVFGFVFDRFLSYLNSRNWKPDVPEEMKDTYDQEKYLKARGYEQTRNKFSLWSSLYGLVLILIMLFADGFAILDQWVRGISKNTYLIPMIFFGVLLAVSDILNLPFSIYSTFVIEEKFGFNKTTAKTFVLDKIKGAFLIVIIGGLILFVFIWLYNQVGVDFWWMAWIFLSVFSLFMVMFYTSLIVPLFNKLKPMEEGDLRSAIESFCQNVGFKLNDLFVMDGSKRSSKSNAYFSGLGPKKKIVLFDTLIEQQEKNEIVAVLAHEIGHYKLKHSRKTLIISILQTGLMLYLLSWVIDSPVLGKALGVEEMGIHIGLICFSLLYSPVSLISGIFMNILSRKHEFQADAFASEHFNGEHLISALKKLSVENLSNLSPHPLYVFIHYSHPPILQRLKAIKYGNQNGG